MEKLMQLENFIDLLHQLDDILMERNLYLKIKAIGGFAMIYWAKQFDEESRMSSRDIDSLELINDEILKIIKWIAQKNNVDNKWLNNDWIKIKNGNEEFDFFAEWIKPKNVFFNNIDLLILDLETMFFFKMRAVDDRIRFTKYPPRQQDVRDLYLIMKIFDEHDIYNIKNTKMSSCVQYFPYARDYMSGREPE